MWREKSGEKNFFTPPFVSQRTGSTSAHKKFISFSKSIFIHHSFSLLWTEFFFLFSQALARFAQIYFPVLCYFIYLFIFFLFCFNFSQFSLSNYKLLLLFILFFSFIKNHFSLHYARHFSWGLIHFYPRQRHFSSVISFCVAKKKTLCRRKAFYLFIFWK